jgi:hypothetical protein
MKGLPFEDNEIEDIQSMIENCDGELRGYYTLFVEPSGNYNAYPSLNEEYTEKISACIQDFGKIME